MCSWLADARHEDTQATEVRPAGPAPPLHTACLHLICYTTPHDHAGSRPMMFAGPAARTWCPCAPHSVQTLWAC